MLIVEKVEKALENVFVEFGVVKHQISIIKGNPYTLEIRIALENGEVDLEICDKVSQSISKVLDEIDDSDDNYLLDVCSFGLEQPLDSQQDIIDAINKYIHIELFTPQDGKDTFEGTLLDFKDSKLTIQYFVKGVKKKLEVSQDMIKFIRLAVKL